MVPNQRHKRLVALLAFDQRRHHLIHPLQLLRRLITNARHDDDKRRQTETPGAHRHFLLAGGPTALPTRCEVLSRADAHAAKRLELKWLQEREIADMYDI